MLAIVLPEVYCVPEFVVPACAINHGWGETMVAKARLLLLGLDPDIVDYTKSPVPGLTAAKVRSAVEADWKRSATQ